MIQTSKNQTWIDETNAPIPYKRTTTLERSKEKNAAILMKDAQAINKRLLDFKETIKEHCKSIYDQASAENNVKLDGKGNYTWFNFDRSIKIEVSISDRVTFDDLTIAAAKQKLDEFLDANIDVKIEFVKDIITEAFSTSKGKLDSKKVLSLLKYRDKVKDLGFQEALNLIEKAVRRPDSKTYHRVFVKDEDGRYNAIELNFSNI